MSRTNPYVQKSDEELIRILNSSKAAEHEFYRRYRVKILWMIKKYRLDNLEREDVVQEGMIGLYYAIQTFDDSRGFKFSTYASVCIKNRVKNTLSALWRSSSKRDESFDVEEAATVESPEEEALIKERSATIERAVKSLGEIEKYTLSLYLEKKSYREIAKELAISSKKVDNILMKVKAKLARQVRSDLSFDGEHWNTVVKQSIHRGLSDET